MSNPAVGCFISGVVRLLLLASLLPALAVRAASPLPAGADGGMVVTAQHLATRVGVEVLRQGGHAVDAAVAVGYALAVVYPSAGNLGGGGFMTVVLADGRRHFLDFRETAPLAARPDMYLDAQGQVVPGRSTRGHLAVAVPGSVHGLETAHRRWGRLPRAALIEPAIRLADSGFELDQGDIEMFQLAADDLRRDPASAAIFLRDGQVPKAGDRLVQRDLAATLRRIRDQGAAGFYQGPVGSMIVRAVQAGGGIITQADLDQYTTREREPLECDYRGYRVVSAPPPSSGGVVMCQVLQVLQGLPLREWGWGSARATHATIEALRHAYRDRNTTLGDPAFVDNPIAALLDPGYAERIRQAIGEGRAGASLSLQPPLPQGAGAARAAATGAPLREGSNTTHYSIVDAQGNAVSVTYTLNGWFGARVTAEGTGVLLNNEMDDFTVKAGVPNLFGLVQGPANAIAPGKRPLSSMSPTVVLREGRPVLVLGTPGGSRIITTLLHTLVNLIDHGMTLQEAIDAPRLHQQWLPEATNVERFALSPDTRALLEAQGHRFSGPQPANHVAAIIVGAPVLEPAAPAAPGGQRPLRAWRFWGALDPRRPTGLALGP